MAVPRSGNPNRTRNVFLIGLVVGAILILILGALKPDTKGVSKDDLNRITDRLSAIEEKLATPTPNPSASPAPGGPTISQINKDLAAYTDKTVEVTGKVNSPHQGVGFIVVDTDGTYLWVHTHAKIPTATATVKGKVTTLTDQLAQWKTEDGWPADDSALTAKLRQEKAFIEAESVS